MPPLAVAWSHLYDKTSEAKVAIYEWQTLNIQLPTNVRKNILLEIGFDDTNQVCNLLRNLEPKNSYEKMVPLTNNQVDIPSLKLRVGPYKIGANSQKEMMIYSNYPPSGASC